MTYLAEIAGMWCGFGLVMYGSYRAGYTWGSSGNLEITPITMGILGIVIILGTLLYIAKGAPRQ